MAHKSPGVNLFRLFSVKTLADSPKQVGIDKGLIIRNVIE